MSYVSVLCQLSVLCFDCCSFLSHLHFSWCVTVSYFPPALPSVTTILCWTPFLLLQHFLNSFFSPPLLFFCGKSIYSSSGEVPLGSLRRCCCLLICLIRVGNFSCGRVIRWLYQAIINLTATTRCKRCEQHWVKLQKTKVVLWEDPGQQWTLRQHRCTSVLESLKRFLGRVTSSSLVLLYISVPWLLRPWCRRESGRAALGLMTWDPSQDTRLW